MKHRPWIVLVLAALLCLAPAALAQDDGAPSQINAALQDLASRLGRTVLVTDLDSWTYAANRYTNTNLGCPLASGTDVVEGVTGYTFTLILDDVTYEYRVSADSSIVVPCSQNLVDLAPAPTVEGVPSDVTPAVTGEACPQDFIGLLTPRVSPNSRAEIIGAAPSRLRSGPGLSGTQTDLINPGTVIDIIGGPICADEYVWWQVAVNGQTGWVAEGGLPDTYFIAPVAAAVTPTPQATPAATLTPVPATVSTATPLPEPGETVVVETGDLPEMAAVVDNATLSLFDVDAANVLTETTTLSAFAPEFGPALYELAWSPDGRRLIYGVRGEGDGYVLYRTDVAGSEPVLLTDDAEISFPVTFSPTGTQVYYARPGNPTAVMEDNQVPVNIFVQDLTADTEAELVGTIGFGVGCGGGSPFPGDAVYDWEAGFMGNGTTFAMTPYGLVYTTACTGDGLALLDLQTGISTPLGDQLGRAVLSPNGERLVAVEANGNVLTVVDLATLSLTPLGTVADPDQVAWGGDDVIFYSTRTDTGIPVPGSESETFGAAANVVGGVPTFDLSIHRVDLTQTTDAEIWAGSGWVVSRLYGTADGNALFFNLIPSGEAWVQAISSGTLTAQNDGVALAYPDLFRIDLTTGAATQLAENLVMPTFNTAAFAAPTDDVTVG